MNCRVAEELIQRSLDAPLFGPERARLEDHLSACPACRRSHADYRRLSQAAGVWARRPAPTEMAPDEFTARVMARLNARPAPQPLWPRLLAVGLGLGVLIGLSPFVSPLLPSAPLWHLTWTTPALDSWLYGWGKDLRAAPQEALGLWTASVGGLMAAHWAALLLAFTLPMNALLCLRVRRGIQRTA